MLEATMGRTGFVYDPLFLEHRPPPGHPERPERLKVLLEHLGGAELWESLIHLVPRPCSVEDIGRAHAPDHIATVERVCREGGGLVDEGDTHVSRRSYEAALLAAGAVTTAIDAVLDGGVDAAFCAVRPPGHHAEHAKPMGFCLFNNVAVGAAYARERRGIERVAILDWDVHHGNGTQHLFEADPSVLFISLHQYPFYPGTGGASERGRGEGEGATINIPLPAGSGEERYQAAFDAEVLPALRRFSPGLLLISAGFDAHREDPLAEMMLEDQSYRRLTALVGGFAPTVSVLEGGYNLNALARSVEAHLRALMGTV
jgi:acetoin utilization deacetylase AcuC-like enzyme